MDVPGRPARDVALVEVEGRKLAFSNLGKVLWPATGATKALMLDYYAAIAPVLLPHLRDRPVTLKRFPDGVDGNYWFQTQCRGAPQWIRTQRIASASRPGRSFDYCVIDDLASLLWAANLGSIELHPLLARCDALDRPTAVVFDLDPGAPADILDCCRVALSLREVLEELGLASFVKTSGIKGVQVFAPIAPSVTFEQTKAFARATAERLASVEHDITARSERALRAGKVLIDWKQNDTYRSIVVTYSLRATAIPLVSTPLEWSELERAYRESDPETLYFGPGDVLRRVASVGDVFAPVVQLEQALPGSG